MCFIFFSQFEYQQAQLEAEIENLSWKIEHAETTDRGDLENQMDIAEKRRYAHNTERRKTKRKKRKVDIAEKRRYEHSFWMLSFLSPLPPPPSLYREKKD